MKENKSQDEVKVGITSIPYFPADIVDETTVEVIQKARQTIEFTGRIWVEYSRNMTIANAGWEFSCTSEEWPEELSFSINITSKVCYTESSTLSTSTSVHITGQSASGGSVTGSGGGSVTANGSAYKEMAAPVSFIVTKDKPSGYAALADFSGGGSGSQYTTNKIDYIGNFKLGTVTFNNLGDNYIGHLTGTCDTTPFDITQPDY